jgi:hypothetical protein
MSQTFAFPSALPEFPYVAEERVQQFEGDEIPREVQALGQPERVYRPSPLFSTLLRAKYLLAIAPPAILAGLYWLIYADMSGKGELQKLMDPLVLGVFGGLFVGALALSFFIARMPSTTATVFFYQRAAVVAEGNRLTLIPWKHLLFDRDRIRTPHGPSFYCGWVEDHDRFEERIWELSAEHWLPEALARIQAGETVTAGELGISATHISFQGKTAAWTEVTHLVVVVGRIYQLNISTTQSRLFSWALVNLHNIPNARAVVDLIGKVAPPHLLTEAAQ